MTTVTQTSAPTPPTSEPTDTWTPTSRGPAPTETADDADDQDDAAWLSEADSACSLAIDEYTSWKAGAGSGAAPEALALGGAAAATHAADSIEALPQPSSDDALRLRAAVTAWAAAYRDLAAAMDSGTYTEVMSAGGAAQAAGDRIRSVAGSAAPSCAAMVHEV